MKAIVPVIVSAILGCAVGAAVAVGEMVFFPWPESPLLQRLGLGGQQVDFSTAPRVQVDEERYDFGVMEADSKGKHAFVIRNIGNGPLTLEEGPTTCKCTASILDKKVLQPGEETRVIVEWKGKNYSGAFFQSATIFTNDPRRPQVTFTVTGRIIKAVRLEPKDIYLTRIVAGETATATFKLLARREEPIKVLGYEFQKKDIAQYFDLELRPLTSQELAECEDATSGYLGTITIKPGLPLGAFNQGIVIKTNSEVAPEVIVAIHGLVTSEVSVIGSGWLSEYGILRIGEVKSSEGTERKLFVRATGPYRDQVQLKVLEVYPEFMEVEVGQPKDLEKANVRMFPLVIRIPKGSPPANHLGGTGGQMGYILFETNHPKVKQLKVKISFAVLD